MIHFEVKMPKNAIISSKSGEKFSENQKQDTNILFRSENPTSYLPLMQLQKKLKETAEMTYLKGNKQQNMVRPNKFRRFEVRRNVELMF